MNLGDLIAALEAMPPETVVADGFANPHSYRGHYPQLAFEPEADTTVGDMLAAAKSAVGATYEGWKVRPDPGRGGVVIAPKREAVVTLPEGKGQVWARFDTDGTPYADYRETPRSTWMPVDMLGGNVEVAP